MPPVKLREAVNRDVLKKIIQVKSKLIYEDQFNVLTKLNKYKCNTHFVNYQKSEYNGVLSGRYFARSKASIQFLKEGA